MKVFQKIALLLLATASALTPTQTRKTLALAGEKTADLKAQLLRAAEGTRDAARI